VEVLRRSPVPLELPATPADPHGRNLGLGETSSSWAGKSRRGVSRRRDVATVSSASSERRFGSAPSWVVPFAICCGLIAARRRSLYDPPSADDTMSDSQFAICRGCGGAGGAQRRCAPTISVGYSAQVWNRLLQPRHVAAGRVENPPYTDPTIRHSPFLPIRHSPLATRHSPLAVVPRSPLAGRRLPPFAIRYSRFAVSFHSLFAIRHSLSLTARRSLLAVFPHSCAAAVCGTGRVIYGPADQSRLRIKWM
jgi:hypothetical protein